MESLLRKYKEIKEKQDMLFIEEQEIRFEILNKMKESNTNNFKSELASVSYTAPTKRFRFDSKEFQKDNPFAYEKYLKETEVKESVKINL